MMTIEKLKNALKRNYWKVSTDNGKRWSWTCSTLSTSGNCVDIIVLDDDGDEYVDTIKVSTITHILVKKNGQWVDETVVH